MSAGSKSSTLTIRLTAAERERLSAAADHAGRSLGAHVKAEALRGAPMARVSPAMSDVERLLALAEEFRARGWKRTDDEIARAIEAERADR